jgi:hypothetical protein
MWAGVVEAVTCEILDVVVDRHPIIDRMSNAGVPTRKPWYIERRRYVARGTLVGHLL